MVEDRLKGTNGAKIPSLLGRFWRLPRIYSMWEAQIFAENCKKSEVSQKNAGNHTSFAESCLSLLNPPPIFPLKPKVQVKTLYDKSKITGENITGYLDPDSSGGLITGFALEFGPIGKMKPEAMDPFAGGLVGSELSGFGGTYKFDPLGLSARWPEHLAWWREAELKHGRVAMLAFVGLLAPDVVRIPVESCMDPDLNFVNAHNQLIEGLGFGPMWWLLTAVGVLLSAPKSQRFLRLRCPSRTPESRDFRNKRKQCRIAI